MRTVGLIGGIAPGATTEPYRFLIDEYPSRVSDGSYPGVHHQQHRSYEDARVGAMARGSLVE